MCCVRHASDAQRRKIRRPRRHRNRRARARQVRGRGRGRLGTRSSCKFSYRTNQRGWQERRATVEGRAGARTADQIARTANLLRLEALPSVVLAARFPVIDARGGGAGGAPRRSIVGRPRGVALGVVRIGRFGLLRRRFRVTGRVFLPCEDARTPAAIAARRRRHQARAGRQRKFKNRRPACSWRSKRAW